MITSIMKDDVYIPKIDYLQGISLLVIFLFFYFDIYLFIYLLERHIYKEKERQKKTCICWFPSQVDTSARSE